MLRNMVLRTGVLCSLFIFGFIVIGNLPRPQTAHATLASKTIEPYLQNVTPNSVWILWADASNTNKSVEWGATSDLEGASVPSQIRKQHARNKNQYVHEARLKNLTPETYYYYRVMLDGKKSRVYRFKTPPDTSSEKDFRFAVYADTQWHPQVHRRIVEKGLKWAANPLFPGSPVEGNLDFVLVAGDLVHVGAKPDQYKERYFDPMASISGSVPYYPAIGNHEYQGLNAGEAPIYLNYFNLPQNGSMGYLGHWYSFNYSNAHVITLNTNKGSRVKFKRHPKNMYNAKIAGIQLAWLRKDLETACNDTSIDFIFTQFHHPNYSELWVTGSDPYSQKVESILESYLNKCNKAGAMFFGHTHAYSRGQSKNAGLYFVVAGTAGGRLDKWGEYKNKDYENMQKSFSSFGFMWVDVTAGEDPNFKITRYSQGSDPNKFSGNSVIDEFKFKSKNIRPEKPQINSHKSKTKKFSDQLVLKASPYQDDDKDSHLESEWQIQEQMKDEWKEIYDKWARFENWYNKVNKNKDIDLTQHQVPKATLYYGNSYRCRVRYRDNALGWSDWSDWYSLKY